MFSEGFGWVLMLFRLEWYRLPGRHTRELVLFLLETTRYNIARSLSIILRFGPLFQKNQPISKSTKQPPPIPPSPPFNSPGYPTINVSIPPSPLPVRTSSPHRTYLVLYCSLHKPLYPFIPPRISTHRRPTEIIDS